MPAEPEKISEAVRRLLAEPDEVERLSAIGRERIGGPGVISEIIGVLDERPAVAGAGRRQPVFSVSFSARIDLVEPLFEQRRRVLVGDRSSTWMCSAPTTATRENDG